MADDEEDDLLVRQVQRIALANVVLGPKSPDAEDAWLRHIFRWYSHEFATPLHTVGALPLEDVLLHYYEALYEQFEDPEIEEERFRLTDTRAQRAARVDAKVEDKTKVDALIARVEAAERARLEGKVPEAKPAAKRSMLPEGTFLPRPTVRKPEPKGEPVLRIDFDDDSMPGFQKPPLKT